MAIGQAQISFETFGHDICPGDDCVGGEGERDESQGGEDELRHNICQYLSKDELRHNICQ